jgi:iron complex transport system substrate-binding protein
MLTHIRTHVISFRLLPALLLCLLSLAACGGQSQSQANNSHVTATSTVTSLKDYFGNAVNVPATAPQRIISLSPSCSEILGALNLQSKVVGVDANTNYPAALAAKKKISDLSGNYNVEQIVALKPDLVLSSNGLTKDVDSQLTRLNITVADLPGANISQTMTQIQSIGTLTHTATTAQSIVQQMKQQIVQIQNAVKGTVAPTVLMEIDDSTPGKPYVFGGGSFGDDLLQYADATNIFHSNTTGGGFPQVTDESVIADNPQYIVLTEDPKYGGDPSVVYKRPNWGSIAAVKSHQVYHINSDILQRPDPRIVEGLRCLAQVVHPDKFAGALPAYCTASV